MRAALPVPAISLPIRSRSVVAHLHRGLRDARYLLAILLKVREVAADEDLRVPFLGFR